MYNIIQANNRIVKNKVSMARGGAGAVDQGRAAPAAAPAHTTNSLPTYKQHIS